MYDNSTKQYVPGTKFEDILKLYLFDQELSVLIFAMISKIEVALRVRLVEALLTHGDALILQDSSIFDYFAPGDPGLSKAQTHRFSFLTQQYAFGIHP